VPGPSPVDDVLRADERAPEGLTAEQRVRREAALNQLRQWGDPVLRSTTTPVATFDRVLREEVSRMAHLMDEAIGAGLAAPQVGSAHRLFVCRLGEDAELTAMVNPRIAWASEETQRGVEGCLSIPVVVVEVERALAVTLVAQDERGREREVRAEGPDAVVLQHELDHLDGVLMLDRADPDERRRAIRRLRELGR